MQVDINHKITHVYFRLKIHTELIFVDSNILCSDLNVFCATF